MATTNNAKITITPAQAKAFALDIKRIKGSSEELAQAIHNAGMIALQQCNEHGNIDFGKRIIEAMGKKHDSQRVVNWLVHFGRFGVKEGVLIFRKRKDITPETIGAMYAKAQETPYWELTPQKKLVETVDYMSMLLSLVNRHKAVEKKQAEGKEVEEKNVHVLAEVSRLIEKLTVKQAKQAAAVVEPVKV